MDFIDKIYQDAGALKLNQSKALILMHIKIIYDIIKNQPKFNYFEDHDNIELILKLINELKKNSGLCDYGEEFNIDIEEDELENDIEIKINFSSNRVNKLLNSNNEEADSDNEDLEINTKVNEEADSDNEDLKINTKVNEEADSDNEDLEINTKVNEQVNTSEIENETLKKNKKETKVVMKKEKSNGENKKRGRPKMGKTLWKDVIIKSSPEWQEGNSFIKNIIEEENEISNIEDELLTKYEPNIISKIYRMINSMDYSEYLKVLYKKDVNIMEDLNGENKKILFIKGIISIFIEQNEKKEIINSLIKENIPEELELIK